MNVLGVDSGTENLGLFLAEFDENSFIKKEEFYFKFTKKDIFTNLKEIEETLLFVKSKNEIDIVGIEDCVITGKTKGFNTVKAVAVAMLVFYNKLPELYTPTQLQVLTGASKVRAPKGTTNKEKAVARQERKETTQRYIRQYVEIVGPDHVSDAAGIAMLRAIDFGCKVLKKA